VLLFTAAGIAALAWWVTGLEKRLQGASKQQGAGSPKRQSSREHGAGSTEP
jgi:hypothetical protein